MGPICNRAALISSSVKGAAEDINPILEVDARPLGGTVLGAVGGSSLSIEGCDCESCYESNVWISRRENIRHYKCLSMQFTTRCIVSISNYIIEKVYNGKGKDNIDSIRDVFYV